MPRPDVTVVLPACAWPDPADLTGAPHPHLERALDSVAASAAELQVELLVGVDGRALRVIEAVERWRAPARVDLRVFVVEKAPAPTWGNRQRNLVLDEQLATGRFIAWQDQDDVFVPGALERVVCAADATPGALLLCRMRVHHWNKHPVTLWRERVIARGAVGGHMIVAPNEPALLGRWAPETEYTADFEFIRETAARFERAGRELVWLDELVSELRPPGPAARLRATVRA